jgi:hypothetical protein
MANINDIHSVIVAAGSANLTAHTYSEIYGGSAGCTITVNGTSLSVGASSNVKVWIRTVSGGSGCFLLGEYKDVYSGSSGLGGSN